LGRTISRILSPLSIIDRRLGQFARTIALTAIGGAIAGPFGAAIGGAIASGLNSLDPEKAPKPDNQNQSQKQPIPPRTYAYGRSRLHPYFALYDTAENGTTVDVYAFADGQAHEIEYAYLNDEKITVVGEVVQEIGDGKYADGKVKAGWTLGPAVNTAFSNVISLLPDIWTTNHRGDGIVTGYVTKASVKTKDFTQTYPDGDNTTLSLVGKWQLCYDPRSNAVAWTENPVLHLLHYITVRRGYDYATRIAPTVQFWIDAANICDEPVALKSGSTEPRYKSCVTYSAVTAPKEVIGSFLETFDGWMAPRGDGALVVFAGKLYTPTVTIGPDEIYSYNFQNAVADENIVDQYAVSYNSEEHDWNSVETTPWGGELGVQRTDSISPQVPSFSQARRLAKRKFAMVNSPNRGNVSTNIGGRKARGHRYIYLNLAEEGFDPFEGLTPIVEIQSMTRDMAAGGVAFEWIAVDPNIDSWNPATEEGEPAAKGDRVEQQPVETPIITSAVPEFGLDSGTGSQGVYIIIDVDGPDRTDLTWFARTRTVGAAVWGTRSYDDIDPGSTIQLATEFVPTDAMIEVEVAYQIGDGRNSDWSTPTTIVDTSTANVPAGQVNTLAATGGAGTATITWRNPTSSNLAYERLYIGNTNVFSAASQIGGNYAAGLGAEESVTTPVTAGTRYAWVRTYNNTGVAGTPFGPVSFVVT